MGAQIYGVNMMLRQLQQALVIIIAISPAVPGACFVEGRDADRQAEISSFWRSVLQHFNIGVIAQLEKGLWEK